MLVGLKVTQPLGWLFAADFVSSLLLGYVLSRPAPVIGLSYVMALASAIICTTIIVPIRYGHLPLINYFVLGAIAAGAAIVLSSAILELRKHRRSSSHLKEG